MYCRENQVFIGTILFPMHFLSATLKRVLKSLYPLKPAFRKTVFIAGVGHKRNLLSKFQLRWHFRGTALSQSVSQ